MSTVSSRTAPRRPLRWTFTDAAAVTRRNLYRYVRVPTLLLFSTIQPVMFVLLFTYVFGGAIQVPGVEHYIDFLMAGILVQTVVFGSTQTGVALAEDMSRGMIDRFRSLPMARSAVLAGRTLSDTVRNLFVVSLMLVVGTLIGFRFHAGVVPAIGAVALALAFGLAFSWISAFIGLSVARRRVGPGGRVRLGVPAGVRLLGLRPGGKHARLAAGVRAGQPDHRHRQRAAGPDPWRAHHPAPAPVPGLDRRHPGGVRPPGRQPLPSRRRVG